MKRFFTTLSMLLAALMLSVSCDQFSGLETPDDNQGESNQPGNNTGGENNGIPSIPNGSESVSQLTPGQHKQRLEEIGMEFLSYFNAEEQQELADAILALAEVWDEDLEEDVAQTEVSFNNSFVDVGSRAMMTSMLGIAQGSPMAMVEFATRAASEDFIVDINEYGGMCLSYDGEFEEWKDTGDAKNNEIKIVWPDNYMAYVTWNNSNKIWECTIDDVRYRVYVPSEINFAITSKNKNLVTVSVYPKLTDNYSIAPDVKVTITGGFVYNVKSSADPKGLNVQFTMSKGQKLLVSAAATIAINDFTDPNNWYYEDSYSWEDGYGNTYYENRSYYDPAIYLVENAKTGQFQVDILGLTMVGMGDYRTIYDTMERYDDQDWDESKWADKMVELINKEAECKLFYNDTKEKVCDIVAQKYKWTDEYWYWNGYEYVSVKEDYYSAEPILLFPDGSKYSFENYFTSKGFQKLIEAFWQIVEEYYNLVGEEF